MKKLLLFATAVCVSVGVYAQKSPAKVKAGVSYETQKNFTADDANILIKQTSSPAFVRPATRGTSDISVVNLGTSANAYGLYNGGRSVLSVDPVLNSVAFFHRMAASPGSGYIGYDISTDGGATWTVNQQLYAPVAGANARYPQGGIYNPDGNITPNNAFVTSFAPILDGSNGTAGSWGGYGSATAKIDGSSKQQTAWSSVPPIRHNVPDAFAINPVSGDVFVVDPSLIGGLGNQYVDTLIITRGVFNDATSTYDFTQSLLYAPVNTYGTSIADTRIAFAPDGLVGYILTLSDNGQDPMATGLAYYPILYKTTDGGLTWDDDAITVPLGGPDGIAAVINDLLTDDQIAELYEAPLPERDEIPYTTAFTGDFAVDMNGNPVISVVVGVAASTAYSIVSASGFFAPFNLFSQDGGDNWLGFKVAPNLKTFRGEWGGADGISEDNRSQITSSPDGSKMFFSWLDTDFEGQADNLQPDIFCTGWDIATNLYTDPVNVTYLSDAWLVAFMGTAADLAFPAGDDYIIPFMYQEMNATDPAQPVQYKYITDFTFNAADFYIQSAPAQKLISGISQNYPNPFNGSTQIDVTLTKPAQVSLEVYNIVGQKVYEIPARRMNEGMQTLQISSNNLKPGIYTYSVIANGERTTHKMMVN